VARVAGVIKSVELKSCGCESGKVEVNNVGMIRELESMHAVYPVKEGQLEPIIPQGKKP